MLNAVAIVSASVVVASLIINELEVALPGQIDFQDFRGLLFIKFCNSEIQVFRRIRFKSEFLLSLNKLSSLYRVSATFSTPQSADTSR